MMRRRDFLACGLATLSAPTLGAGSASAQESYPNRIIRMIVPYPPGGSYDIIARPWAERMKPLLGAIVVENIGGAGGAIGVQTAARAAPDGYTILLGGASTHIPEVLLKLRPTYDPLKDIAPVSGIVITALAVVVHSSVPVSNLKDFVTYAKNNPGKLSYGSAGVGTMNHLAGEMLKQVTGITDLPHVAYRGAGPALNDVISGQIPAVIPTMTNQVYELHKTGRIKILAVMYDKRLEATPDLPTAAEQGYPEMVAANFTGLFIGAQVPKPIIERISEANRKLLDDPGYRKLLVSHCFVPQPGLKPDDYRLYIESEIERWRPIVKRTGIRLE